MKKLTDMELQEESMKAAQYYLKHTQQEGLGIVEKSRIMTQVSHGFFMGWRKLEEKIEGEKNVEPTTSAGV